MIERWIVGGAVMALWIGCGPKSGEGITSSSTQSTSAPTTTATATPGTTAKPIASTASSGLVSAGPGGDTPTSKPPPDGKYERVTVEGVTVPMIEVTENGTVVLVDTDGKKPRTWEEQYKKKRDSLAVGSYDIHKTDVNKNNDFKDDAIDKEGLWVIDDKGNITKH